MCKQCKGKNNKDVEQTEKLTHLRIALTGKHKDILRVEKRDGL